ncbi:unnamed protein product [Closterium sp. Naga37s-1]|nr:unnamed protein product [Closterium sp. Naga37s-1]
MDPRPSFLPPPTSSPVALACPRHPLLPPSPTLFPPSPSLSPVPVALTFPPLPTPSPVALALPRRPLFFPSLLLSPAAHSFSRRSRLPPTPTPSPVAHSLSAVTLPFPRRHCLHRRSRIRSSVAHSSLIGFPRRFYFTPLPSLSPLIPPLARRPRFSPFAHSFSRRSCSPPPPTPFPVALAFPRGPLLLPSLSLAPDNHSFHRRRRFPPCSSLSPVVIACPVALAFSCRSSTPR